MESIFCSKCGTSLVLPVGSENSQFIKCCNCDNTFKNPYFGIVHRIQKKPKPPKNYEDDGFRVKIVYITFIIFLCLIVFLVIRLNSSKSSSPSYDSNSQQEIINSNLDDSENNVNDSNYQSIKNSGDETIDLNSYTGKKFTFKSKLYDIESNGKIIETKHETTYHSFDFVNLTVTQKSSLNGKWFTITYPIKDFYQEKGVAATTYVIVVNQLGVKEIWFSPDVPNLGYDYEDGTRIACYELKEIK